MFVFERSLWSVVAGLGTAAGLVLLMLLMDSAVIRTPLERPVVASAPHDISLANR
jgi:hypothetical protein